ncbi:hypothetical protein SMICM17S_05223 [Streptomyces microflavus]
MSGGSGADPVKIRRTHPRHPAGRTTRMDRAPARSTAPRRTMERMRTSPALRAAALAATATVLLPLAGCSDGDDSGGEGSTPTGASTASPHRHLEGAGVAEAGLVSRLAQGAWTYCRAQLPSYGKLNSRYDLVGFDPRGVAASSGVSCRTDEEQEQAARSVDLTPDTAAEEAAFVKDGADFGAGCLRRSGKVLPHVGTSSAARDLDLIRQVLGDAKLSYFGFSYGTELGGTYAHLFPQNVGRTVLDAVVDPTADGIGHARNQATGFQRALENYLKDRGQDPKAGSERIARLLARIDRKPLPTASGRELTESLAITGIVTPLYSQSGWPTLTAALDEAENKGTGDGLLRLADSYNGRDEEGRYDTQSHSQRAISCADSKARPTVDEARALLPEFRRLSPVFGPFLAWDTAGWCAQWPVEGEHETPETSAPGAGPILVIGTTGDPATPYEGAQRMADELGKGVGIMVTNKGEGHGAYGQGDCVTSTVDDYFLDGKVPQDGTTCG